MKDEETFLNAERKRRIQYFVIRKYKRDNILEKQLEDSYRLQIKREEKEEEIKKKLDLANKTMIEKERFFEVVTSINKTPESKILTKKFNNLELD